MHGIPGNLHVRLWSDIPSFYGAIIALPHLRKSHQQPITQGHTSHSFSQPIFNNIPLRKRTRRSPSDIFPLGFLIKFLCAFFSSIGLIRVTSAASLILINFVILTG